MPEDRGVVMALFGSKKKSDKAFDALVGDLVSFGDLMELPYHYGGLTTDQAAEIEEFARGGGSRKDAIAMVQVMVKNNAESRRASGEVIGAADLLTSIENGSDVWHTTFGRGWVAQVINEGDEHAAVVEFKLNGIQVIELPTSEMEVWRD